MYGLGIAATALHLIVSAPPNTYCADPLLGYVGCLKPNDRLGIVTNNTVGQFDFKNTFEGCIDSVGNIISCSTKP